MFNLSEVISGFNKQKKNQGLFKPIVFLLMSAILLSCSAGGSLAVKNLQDTEAGPIKLVSDKSFIDIVDTASGRSYIKFPIDKPFLTAAVSIDTASYRMASFKFKEDIQSECKGQSIDSISSVGNSIIIKGELSGENCSTGYELILRQDTELSLNFEVKLSKPEFNRIKLLYGSTKDEQFFGFGTQYSHFNLKGKKLFIFTEEQGIGRGDQPITFLADITNGAGGNEFTSYSSIPHYITSLNRSVFFENTSYSKFDLSDENEVSVEFRENNLKGTIWLGSGPLDLIEKYTLKTGRFPVLPEWAYGTWLGLQGGAEKVKRVVKDAKAAGNPVTAIWIQDWVGKRTTNFGDQLKWRWYAQEKSEFTDSKGNPEPSYPDFKNFCADMNRDGIKVLGYINPFLADTNPKVKGDTFTNPMLAEAKVKGYLIKNAQGEDYLITTAGFPAYLIDITNPAAVKWIKNIIRKNMIDQGLSGWMADFGEWLPYDAVMFDKSDPKLYHNVYPVDWARINREAIAEAGKEGEIVFFSRAGFSYSNKYSTAFWLGDQMVTFGTDDGLPSTIVGLMSSGVSGLSVNHSDVGGYTGIKALPAWISPYDRTRELTERWAEANAFTAIFRTHEGNIPGRFHQVYNDADSIKSFALMGRVHYALKDYIAFLSKEAAEKGYPIVRHPYLNFPLDRNTYDLKYQFMLGEDMLILPVVEKGEDEVKGYFPAGSWKHVFTGEIVEGEKFHTVKAPIGRPAAYVKTGGKWSDRIYTAIQNSLK
ncbi:MAG: alpha-glucosidase [Spirochaetae bacterium HGW-Spirochaetae-5]|nr:MAG: alpha-glucosidase [Spirochaetae bacterium HGW-Spirochaetae-5]